MLTRGCEPLKHRKNAGIDCGSRTCKPNSVRLAAGRSFLWATHYCEAQATYPEVVARRAGTRSFETEASQELPPYLVLLRVGFAVPAALLRRRCALTAPFHPYLTLRPRRYVFCGTFRPTGLNRPSRTLSGTLLCGVRTFLPSRDERPSGPAANPFIIVHTIVHRRDLTGGWRLRSRHLFGCEEERVRK